MARAIIDPRMETFAIYCFAKWICSLKLPCFLEHENTPGHVLKMLLNTEVYLHTSVPLLPFIRKASYLNMWQLMQKLVIYQSAENKG